MTEQKELIARLRYGMYELIPYLLMRQAADMLEADAQSIDVAYSQGFIEGERAAIVSQAVPQEPVAWQPIETAPKGLIVLIREPRCSGLAALYLNGWKYESGGICYLEPTHWMPLPPSPDAAPQPQRPKLTEREIDLLDGMIEIQLQHAERCDAIPNRTMAEKQKGWDMERVALLRKVRGEA